MITGQKTSTSQPLRGFANLHNDGNMKELATSTNVFFQQVAADLRPLDDDVTPPSSVDHILDTEFTINQAEVERKLSEINIYKAPGPDGLPNWLLRDFSAQLTGPVCAIVPAPHSGGPPFRRSAIPGVRVRVNPSGPPEWRTSRMADRNRAPSTMPHYVKDLFHSTARKRMSDSESSPATIN